MPTLVYALAALTIYAYAHYSSVGERFAECDLVAAQPVAEDGAPASAVADPERPKLALRCRQSSPQVGPALSSESTPWVSAMRETSGLFRPVGAKSLPQGSAPDKE